MKLTKTLCGVTAALTVLSSMAVTAQAEETQLKLLIAPVSDVDGTEDISRYGGGCFAANYKNGYFGKFFYIGKEELDEWKKTGKFTYADVKWDISTNDLWGWSGDFRSGYAQFARMDSSNNVTERYILKFDENAKRLDSVYTMPSDWCYTSGDGYTVSNTQIGSNTIMISVFDPTGKRTDLNFTSPGDSYKWDVNATSGAGKYIAYMTFKTEVLEKDEMFGEISNNFVLYGICKDGKYEVLTEKNGCYGLGTLACGDNYVSLREIPGLGYGTEMSFYSVETGKTYYVDPSGDGFFNKISGAEIYGTKAVAEIQLGYDDNAEKQYALIDLNVKNKYDHLEPISKQYKSMNTVDGKIFSVETLDGKFGYIDSNGKELAMFDSVGIFYGDNAPVVKAGKAYLVDRNMNKVSDEIAAESVKSLGDGLYIFTANGQGKFVTYVEPENQSTTSEPTASEPTTSEPIASEPVTSEPTSSDTASSTETPEPNNPATGITMAMIPVALLGGAAVVVAKKRKK